MGKCKSVCQLCGNLVISQAVTFTDDTLVINLPGTRSYANGDKICIVVAQTIPDTVTINAPVGITIGDGTTVFPLTDRCCAQLTACGIQARTKYSTYVSADIGGNGAFKLIGNPRYCAPNNTNAVLDPGATTGGETT